MFKLELIGRDITEFNEENQDWSGGIYSAYYHETKDIEDLSIESIVEGVEKITFGNIKNEDIFIDDNHIMFGQVENAKGEYDERGKYLADYTFKITQEIEVKLEDYNN